MKSNYIKCRYYLYMVHVCVCVYHLYCRVSHSDVVILSFYFVTLLNVFIFLKGDFKKVLKQKNINSFLLKKYFSIKFYKKIVARNLSNSLVPLSQRFGNP